ncbi:MAG: DUF4382 domain-containing protein [Cyanobacteria bacterium J06623_7]
MKKMRIIAYGIAVSSLLATGIISSESAKTIAASTETGNLTLVANGEDFVRQGFVSKDGWQIDFEHLYVNVGSAIAYSSESAFEPQKNATKEDINYQNRIELVSEPQIADLAAGTADAPPITVAASEVPIDFYNALAWSVDTAGADSPIAGQTIVMIGRAAKDGQTIDFNLGLNHPTAYVCGEFVGDERQGIVTAESAGTTEMTFHFDHIFGDADTPPEDALNLHALGFEPLAELASNNTVQLDDQELEAQLSAPDYQQLTETIADLGHVGEGHCVVTNSQ